MAALETMVIGAGLAGSEASWQLAERGIQVHLYEMRPNVMTAAHHTGNFAELVCSNSLRSDDISRSAVGLIHEEMRRLDSLIMRMADAHKVPAGSALAVDRDGFSAAVTEALRNHPNITIHESEIAALPLDSGMPVIMATGPLTGAGLAQSLQQVIGEKYLAFFDAIAPIIHKESIDFSKAWFQSRYDKGEGDDYINCPMTEDEYYTFVDALIEGEKVDFKEWEKDTPYFNGCLPIEVMAERGRKTLSFGPMKPVGLTNPHGPNPYAVVQLRQDNKLGTLYNMVGFQTKLKWGEQTRIFRMIPGLENAEFARLGGLHRNTFINSPSVLDETLRLRAHPHIRIAGQITGVEGYVESAACGLMAGLFTALELLGNAYELPPVTCAHGALLSHITGGAEASSFQPMNINYGLMPPLGRKLKKTERPAAYAERALDHYGRWRAGLPIRQISAA